MTKSYITEFIKDPERLKLFQQERLLVDVAAMICQLMKTKNMNRKELADALQVTKGRVTQILGGERNLTLRTLADIFTVLGVSLTLNVESLAENMQKWESIPGVSETYEVRPLRRSEWQTVHDDDNPFCLAA